jgi:hypothetical protein
MTHENGVRDSQGIQQAVENPDVRLVGVSAGGLV